MNTTLRKSDIYVGQSPYIREERYHVLGSAFGPCMLAADCELSEAFDEWDERETGRHVDLDDPALADYEGETVAERIESAMAEGDIRCNDGGTLAWADPYEWCRSFRTAREAGHFFRIGWRN